MNRILLSLAFLSFAGIAGAQAVPDIKATKKIDVKAPLIHYSGTATAARPAEAAPAAAPIFTADVPEAHGMVWGDNFDKGITGWTFDPTSYVTWSTKTTSGDKAFSKIDSADKSSLYVEGPYQVYRREISSATSGEFTVPFNGKLHLWVGMSLNYDDVCRLLVSISDDDFETSTEVWNSKDAAGERPWAWREVSADLASWTGKNVKLRLTYSWGSKDETFKTGGYQGDFTIDDVRVSGLRAVDRIELTTGEKVRLVSLDPSLTDFRWSMPGASVEESSEASPEVYYTADGLYDVTLTAKKGAEEVTCTLPGFVSVTGTAPVARILPPATFREASSHNFMVAPLAPVTFRSASEGFPSECMWVFSGVTDGEPNATVEVSGEEAVVSYMYQHSWPVGLAVANEHGSSSDVATVCAEFQGGITNTLATDTPTTFDMADWGVFPGTNTHGITRYAEHFSAPSVPMVVGGAYVYFVDAPSTVAITDNTSVGVHLYTCENGLPGECVDSYWWSVIDLDGPTSDGSLQGTFFEFTDMPVVSDEFFIVVDGLPDYSEECRVSFAMAPQRAEGNTAYMEIDGQWRPVRDYFAAGKGTSYYITPVVRHSVITSLPVGDDTVKVGNAGGEVTHDIFSIMGYETPVESDADWCEVVSEPNGMTVDTLTIRCQPNDSDKDREAHLRLTDGVGTHVLTVIQSAQSGVEEIATDSDADDAVYYNLQGIPVSRPSAGQIYIRRTAGNAAKVRF